MVNINIYPWLPQMIVSTFLPVFSKIVDLFIIFLSLMLTLVLKQIHYFVLIYRWIGPE